MSNQTAPVATHADVIDRLVTAYNDHDARAFADLFTADATHGSLRNDAPQLGREAIFERYEDVFSQFPQNRTEVVHRIVVGSFVVDHERVRRTPDGEPFEVVAIYEMQDGKIACLDFLRE